MSFRQSQYSSRATGDISLNVLTTPSCMVFACRYSSLDDSGLSIILVEYFFHFQQVESAYESYAVLFQSDVFRHPIPKHPTIVGEHVDSSGANVS